MLAVYFEVEYKMNRRMSRETAFALMFEWSFKSDELDKIIENATEGHGLEIDDFAKKLANMAFENIGELDALIQKYSDNWKLGRLSQVTLAALRIAFCELAYFPDIPVAATINEAVELLKKYAGEQEASYGNGLLGAYAREQKGEVVEKKVTRIRPKKADAEPTSDEIVDMLAQELGGTGDALDSDADEAESAADKPDFDAVEADIVKDEPVSTEAVDAADADSNSAADKDKSAASEDEA